MSSLSALLGRVLIAALFVFSGAATLANPAACHAMLAAAGLPLGLAMPAAVFEIAAGLMLGLGLLTRMMVLLLSLFTVLTIVLIHNRWDDPVQMALALKNLAIFGGLLMVFAHSGVRWEYKAFRRKQLLTDPALDRDPANREGGLKTA